MTHMTLKERYEMKTELLEAFDKNDMQKLVNQIKKIRSVDFGGLSTFENLKKNIEKGATRAISKKDEKSALIMNAIDETLDVVGNFFENLDSYVSAITSSSNEQDTQLALQRPLIDLIKNTDDGFLSTFKKKFGFSPKDQFLKMIKAGLRTSSGKKLYGVGVLNSSTMAKEIARLRLDKLKEISASVKQAYGQKETNSTSQTSKPQQNQDGEKTQTPPVEDDKVNNTTKKLESKLFNAYGVKTSGDLLVKLGLNKVGIEDYQKLIAAIAKSLN